MSSKILKSLHTFCIKNSPFSYLSKPPLNRRFINIKISQAEAPKSKKNHDEKNIKLNRPMSPHLTIYQLQLTSVLSITHRFTGMILTMYGSMLGLGAIFLPHDFYHYVTIIEGMDNLSILVLKILIALPASYHTCNGVRHLLWDSGRFLTIKAVYYSGYLMVAATILSTMSLISL